jgi:methyl-accepting chemotaxis protein
VPCSRAPRAHEGVQQVSLTAVSLTRIGTAVTVIGDMNLQIASAAEQQSTVAEEVSRNVVVIRDGSESLAAQIEEARRVSQNLNEQAQRQHLLTAQFRA